MGVQTEPLGASAPGGFLLFGRSQFVLVQGMTSHVTPERKALETEADRLFGAYIRVTMVCQKRRLGFLEGGTAAVAAGLVSAADWDLIQEMARGPSEAEEQWRHRLEADPRSLGHDHK